MSEEEVVNRFLNMIATEYDGNLARQFQNQYILKDKEIEQLQQENKQLKQRNKEIYDGFMAAIDEVCETDREKRKYKDRIDKAIEYCKTMYTYGIKNNRQQAEELLEILGDKE